VHILIPDTGGRERYTGELHPTRGEDRVNHVDGTPREVSARSELGIVSVCGVRSGSRQSMLEGCPNTIKRLTAHIHSQILSSNSNISLESQVVLKGNLDSTVAQALLDNLRVRAIVNAHHLAQSLNGVKLPPESWCSHSRIN
jgi:hypothetical protein